MRTFLWMVLVASLSCCGTAPVTAEGRVALSFDDGPDTDLTPKVLNYLAAYGFKATFCLVGKRVRDNPAIVARIYAEGHELCNHTYNHAQLTRNNVKWQVGDTDGALADALGIPGYKAPVLRAPGGNIRSVGDCYDGRPFVGWGKWNDKHERFDDIEDTNDWKYRSVSHTTSIAVHARPDSIVLMHDIHKSTIAALPGILARLKEKGTVGVRVSDVWHSSCGTLQASR